VPVSKKDKWLPKNSTPTLALRTVREANATTLLVRYNMKKRASIIILVGNTAKSVDQLNPKELMRVLDRIDVVRMSICQRYYDITNPIDNPRTIAQIP